MTRLHEFMKDDESEFCVASVPDPGDDEFVVECGQLITHEIHDSTDVEDGDEECPHDNIEREPADPAVGIRNEGIWCEDCGKDLSDDPAFEYDYDGDQADLYDPTDI